MSSGLYVPLWCKSNFSFLEGASHPEELVEACKGLGLPTFALTDRDGVYGVVRAHVRALELDQRLILGAEMTVEPDSTIVLLCMDRGGYANLCRLITLGRLRSPKGECRVTWNEVCEHNGGLVALWGGERSLLVSEVEPLIAALDLRDAFGDRLYALLARHRQASDVKLEKRLRERAQRYELPLVASVEVLYHTQERRPLQDVLTCIRHRVTLATAGRKTKPNAEHAMMAPAAFEALFADSPEAVARTLEIAERCTFSMKEIRYRYPAEKLREGEGPSESLRRLTFEAPRNGIRLGSLMM